MAAVQQNGYVLEDLPQELQNDKNIVMAACERNGRAIEYASPSLKQDLDVALVVVTQHPNSIKYIHKDLQRDHDILVAAGMFDENYESSSSRRRQIDGSEYSSAKKIVFSTRFSLDPSSFSEATNFTSLFKKSKYIQRIGNFRIYSPNAFDKKTCDPEWTNFDHPCRGTTETCQYGNVLTTNEGHPTNDCCWRYSFRHQLLEAKSTGGFMLQLVESSDGITSQNAALGRGQEIELDMSREIGNLKVFQVYRPVYGTKTKYYQRFNQCHVDYVVSEICRWYSSKNPSQRDMSVTIIQPPFYLKHTNKNGKP